MCAGLQGQLQTALHDQSSRTRLPGLMQVRHSTMQHRGRPPRRLQTRPAQPDPLLLSRALRLQRTARRPQPCSSMGARKSLCNDHLM